MRAVLFAAMAAASFLSGQIASAADLPKAAPVAVPAAPTWTGWYIGINGGGVWGTTDPSAIDNRSTDQFFAQGNISAVELGASQDFHHSGGTVGGQIGYLYQAGPTILGLEAGFNWMGLKGSAANSALYPLNAPNGFNWNLEGKSDFLFTFLGRIGINMGAWYPYVTGGLAVANLKYTAHFVETFYPTNNTFSFNENKAGYAIGGGAEWRFAQHWLLRGEYLYINFDSVDGTGTIACTPGVGACAASGFNRTTFNFSTKFRENLGRIAISYQW